MSILQIASLLIVLAGLFGAVNYLFLKLPSAIGILIVSLIASFIILGLNLLYPQLELAETVRSLVLDIEFSDSLLEGMLGFLLFSGALQVNLGDLRAQWGIVLLMATLGVVLSTVIVGVAFAWVAGVPLLIALVFGALISPTDPVAVMGILKDAGLRKSLETMISGESLFNDGVGYVVFLLLVGVAFSSGDPGSGALEKAALLFAQEALGGVVLGLTLGWVTFRLMRLIDDYSLEILLTLGLAFGGYELAVALHVSAPIVAVCAGLLIGDVGAREGMSEETSRYVDAFWELIHEVLNAVLFLMIGVEVFAVAFTGSAFVTGIAAIILALIGRLAAVVIPLLILKPFRSYKWDVVPIMTWGGLKGGISIALALSLPESEWTQLVLTCTYVVVIFSIIVQGLTIGALSKRAQQWTS